MTPKKTISIKLNTISNYISQGYGITVAAFTMPLYLQYLGAEAFGLVAFFFVLQNLLNLLDMGLSTTLLRQVAYARGHIRGFENFKNLLKSFELIFFAISLSTVVGIFFAKNWLVHEWIKSVALKSDDIGYCVNIMALIIGIKFFSTLYRGGIIGFEDQVWMNKDSVIINSLKYIGSFLILIYISNEIKHFFEYQLVIGVMEVVFLGRRFYYNLPLINSAINYFKIDWNALRPILAFALSMAYTSTILIVVTQLDKLLLSGALSLNEFGYFSLITLIVGAVISLSTPVFMAFLPKMTMLAAKGNLNEMIDVYVNMTQVITWISFSSAVLIGIFSQEILYSLTGDEKVFAWGHEVLWWYVLGSAIFVLGSFQYYLQNAFGTLRLYVIGSTISFVIMVPLIYFVTINYGPLGAGQLWFAFGLFWFLGWTSVVHKKLLPGFNLRWLLKDLLPILLCIGFLSYLLRINLYIGVNNSRLMVAAETATVYIAFLLATSICVRSFRIKYIKFVHLNFN